MSPASPYSNGGSREPDGDQRDARDRIKRACVCKGKTLKERNYLHGNKGEERLMGMAGKRYPSYLGNWASFLIPQPRIPPSSSSFLKRLSFLMSLLFHEGAQEVLKYSVPGIISFRTIQTCVCFQYHLNLQNKIRQRHKAIKSVLNNTQGSCCTLGLPCIKRIYMLDTQSQHRD